MRTRLCASMVVLAMSVTAVHAGSAPQPAPIVYDIIVPVGTHDFDAMKSAPPAGFPTVHVAATCALGSDLSFSGSTISGNVVAHATGIGTAYGKQIGAVRVTVAVARSSYPRFMALRKHAYLCSFVTGSIRDATGVVIAPRNVSGSVSGTLPVPPAPNSS